MASLVTVIGELFLMLLRNAVPATEFFRIPSDRVVEPGVRIAI
jgi:KUP system potassium uptake protein